MSIISPLIRKIWVLFLVMITVILVLSGCTGPAVKEASPGAEFALSIGESTMITGEELEIEFLEVVSDSRCPTGVECFWQGEVTCLVEITYRESVYRKTLIQPGLSGDPAREKFSDYEITFSVEPYPAAGEDIKKSDYRLRLRIDRR